MEASAHFLHSLASIRSHCSGYTALAKAVTGLNTEATLTCYMLSSYAGTIWGYVLSSYIGTIFFFSSFFSFSFCYALSGYVGTIFLFSFLFCYVLSSYSGTFSSSFLQFFLILFFIFLSTEREYNKSPSMSWF